MGAMLDQREAFVLRAAELLHAYGTPAPRSEGMLRQLMTRLGVEGDVSVTPTALMFTLGDYRAHVLADDWTVSTVDGSLAAHFEHSIAITEGGPEILTAV